MAWDERRASMLAEMGIRLWPVAGTAAGTPADRGHPSPPAERGGGEAGASQDKTALAQGGAAMGDAGRGVAPPVVSGVADATPSAVEALDWTALRAAVAGCTACGLCKGRGHTVFGVGHENAHLMIVGEAPGEQEDRHGEPFVGKAGQLLDNMLRAIGLGRAAPAGGPGGLGGPAGPARPSGPGGSGGSGGPGEDTAARQVFIANVLKCRPPMNRNPLPEEVAQCAPFLRRQVALVRPRVVLAMGRFAVQSLLHSDLPIGRLRGRLHAYEGVPLVVSYHPAYLLRNPADKARAWEDLCLARAALRAAQAAGPAPRGA